MCGESVDFEFLNPLSILDRVNLSRGVRLNKDVVANANLYWDGADELMDFWCLFGLGKVGDARLGEPIDG